MGWVTEGGRRGPVPGRFRRPPNQVAWGRGRGVGGGGAVWPPSRYFLGYLCESKGGGEGGMERYPQGCRRVIGEGRAAPPHPFLSHQRDQRDDGEDPSLGGSQPLGRSGGRREHGRAGMCLNLPIPILLITSTNLISHRRPFDIFSHEDCLGGGIPHHYHPLRSPPPPDRIGLNLSAPYSKRNESVQTIDCFVSLLPATATATHGATHPRTASSPAAHQRTGPLFLTPGTPP